MVEVRWKVQPGSNRADVMVTDSNGDLQWESREREIERERGVPGCHFTCQFCFTLRQCYCATGM